MVNNAPLLNNQRIRDGIALLLKAMPWYEYNNADTNIAFHADISEMG